jgi:predicted nucleic acid-binding protein
MKRILIFVVLASFSLAFLFGQSSHSLIVEGKCYEVLHHLQKTKLNDSIAVEYFKEKYVVINHEKSLEDLNYEEVIKFFNAEENKEQRCCLKAIFYSRSLLISDN